MATVNPYAAQLPQALSVAPGGTINATERYARPDSRTEAEPPRPQRAERPAQAADLRSKVDDLIAQEVSNGKLTAGQGDDLRSVFADAFSGNDALPSREPPAPPPPSQGTSNFADAAPQAQIDFGSVGVQDTNATSSSDALKQFLNSLQEARDAQSAITYSSAGANRYAPTSNVNSLLFDYRT